MLKKTLPVVVVTAVICVGGIAHASWSKSSSGSGYGKGKTLVAPSSLTLSCSFGSSHNNWSLSWTSNASGSESQVITQTDGTTKQTLTATAHTATWQTGTVVGTFTASGLTKISSWSSGSATSNSITTNSSNGKCP